MGGSGGEAESPHHLLGRPHNGSVAASMLPRAELLDHIPAFVDELIRALHPAAVPLPPMSANAQEHGEQRFGLGFNVAEVGLRALGADSGGRTPALALTAFATEDDRQRSLAAGFQLHLTKPIDLQRLSDAVVELVGAPGFAPRRSLIHRFLR